MVQESDSGKKAGVSKRVKQRLIRNRGKLLAFGFIFLFFIIYFAPSIFITVEPGHVGVLFRRFWGGTVTDKIYLEGLHIVSPWNRMYSYDARIQTLRRNVSILSKNGLTIFVQVSVRYHIDRYEAGLLHKMVGPDYRDKIIIPSAISSVREVIGKYLPEQLYTTARQTIQDDILVNLISQTGRIPIIYDDLIVENIKLPALINKAIENKLELQQQYLAYKYKIDMARQEAKRKQIEAGGIKTYQDIVSGKLSDQLLTWLGIRATLQLAKSPNSKIIVIGNSKDGLPLILNPSEAANLQLGKTPAQGDPKKTGNGRAAARPPGRKK